MTFEFSARDRTPALLVGKCPRPKTVPGANRGFIIIESVYFVLNVCAVAPSPLTRSLHVLTAKAHTQCNVMDSLTATGPVHSVHTLHTHLDEGLVAWLASGLCALKLLPGQTDRTQRWLHILGTKRRKTQKKGNCVS